MSLGGVILKLQSIQEITVLIKMKILLEMLHSKESEELLTMALILLLRMQARIPFIFGRVFLVNQITLLTHFQILQT